MINFSYNRNIGAGLVLQKLDPDLLPYACHYDSNTILTKNGELLQTIKISGFSETVINQADIKNLKSMIKFVVDEYIDTTDVALWVHTVRRRVNLDPPFITENYFAQQLHNEWCKKNSWKESFVNELYITLIYRGQYLSINPLNFMQYLSIESIKKSHFSHLEQASKKLSLITEKIILEMAHLGAKLLAIKEDRLGARSENLEFLSRLVNFTDNRIDLPVADYSSYLSVSNIAFGNNTFEIKNDDRHCYGTVLTIKDYQEIMHNDSEEFINLPQEYVITEVITFTNEDHVNKYYKEQDKMLNISEDTWLRKKSGLENMMKAGKNNINNYCLRQTTVMLISKTLDALTSDITNFVNALSKIGVVSVREDVALENIYLSQMPGNFRFVGRNLPTKTENVFEFASMRGSPIGELNSPWGNSVTLFKLLDGTPYFFNFHHDQVGHTIISGPKNSFSHLIGKFLVSESMRFNPEILYLDSNNNSKAFILALGGRFYEMNKKAISSDFVLNPLQLEFSEVNKIFIAKWIQLLLFPEQIDLTQEDQNFIKQVVNDIGKISASERVFKTLSKMISNHKVASMNLDKWIKNEEFSYIFKDEQDIIISKKHPILGIGVGDLLTNNRQLYELVVSYLMHSFAYLKRDNNGIIVINDSDDILQKNMFISYDINSWCNQISNTQSLVIFVQKNDIYKDNPIHEIISQKNYGSIILLPDQENPHLYIDNFKLPEGDIEHIKMIQPQLWQFLIRKSNANYLAEFGLYSQKMILSILEGEKNNLDIIEDLISKSGSNPKKWLDKYEQLRKKAIN